MVLRADDCKQTATYWSPSAPNGYGGWTYDRTEIACRWVESIEQFTNQNGEEKVSKAIIWVLQDLDSDGYLYLGSSAEADPTAQNDAYPIQAFIKIPDLRNVELERRVYL